MNRPEPFSRIRFEQCRNDLSEAILDLSREKRMGLAEIKSRLADISGVGSVKAHIGGGIQLTHTSGHTVELRPSASNEEIAVALNILKIDRSMTEQPMATEQEIATALNKVDDATGAGPSMAAPAPIKKNLTGASFLANLIRQQQADIKKQLAAAGNEMSAAMTELQDVATEATNQVKAVKAETADLKAALGLNSNGSPD